MLIPQITIVYSLLPYYTTFSHPRLSKAITIALVNIQPIMKPALLKLNISLSQILYLALILATRLNQPYIILGSSQRALLQSYLRLNFVVSLGQRLTNILGQFTLTQPILRSARKELAISATAASLGGNPRATSLSIYLIITSSLSLVRFLNFSQ